MNKHTLIESHTSYDEAKKRYQASLTTLRAKGFEPTIAEATYLKEITIGCIDENKKLKQIQNETGIATMSTLNTGEEILQQFFWHYYKINLYECLCHIKDSDELKKAKKDTYKYIQENLRKDMELI